MASEEKIFEIPIGIYSKNKLSLHSFRRKRVKAEASENVSNSSKKIATLENPKAQKLLNKIQRDLMRNGIITNTLVEDLKELRPYAVEEQNPLLAKVIRLTFEHIEEYQTFDIPIPEDEPVEGFEDENEETSAVDPQESLDYLLSLMAEPKNKVNALELREYSNNLIAYAEEN